MRRLHWLLTLLLLTVALPLAAEPPPIKWSAPIDWTPWAQAEAKAKAEQKPLCVVVYGDWCPMCRAIAPFFGTQRMLDASKKAVMVLQNDKEGAGWLQERFPNSGKYVPRIFFVDKNGAIDTSVKSGHPRFPFFYNPNEVGIGKLVQSIDTAVQKAGGPVKAPVPQAAPAVAPPAPAPTPAMPADPPSDMPILIGLVIGAIGAVWLVGRNNG